MAHVHEEDRGYYADQLCTIGVAASLGMICVVLWVRNALGLLADPFHIAVLLGGIALLMVSAARGVTLWAAFARRQPAGHTHEHHDHEHHHHEHGAACDHDHDHAHA